MGSEQGGPEVPSCRVPLAAAGAQLRTPRLFLPCFSIRLFLQKAPQGMCSGAGGDSLVCSDLKESGKNHFFRGVCILCLSLTPICFCTDLSLPLFSPALLIFFPVKRLLTD